jgi:PAS domain S-box-containing protein
MPASSYPGDESVLPGVRDSVPDREKTMNTTPDPFDPDRAEHQSDYLVVYGPDARILFANPAFTRVMRYPAETLTGTSVLLYVAEEDKEMVSANITARQVMGEIPLYEISLVTRDGFRRAVIVKGKPVEYDHRPATLLFLIDITKRKTLEDQLTARAEELENISAAFQLANKKLSLLTTITRHDINNQLTVLKGYLEILETMQPNPTLTGYCTKAAMAAERIAAMIRFTGEYEKIGITAPAWQDCRAIVDEAVREAPLGQISVKNDLPAGTDVFADPLIFKVFYNLMDNAVRYGTTITTIRFSAQKSGDCLVLVCEDDGVGVPPQEKERIFERGFGKNTGLGLALSREILNITGITIAEKGVPGKGARFEMAVPECAVRFDPGE